MAWLIHPLTNGCTFPLCICAAVVFVVASIGTGWVLRVSSAVGLALGAHLVLVLLMVMKRVFALTQNQLRRARTGADRTCKSQNAAAFHQ